MMEGYVLEGVTGSGKSTFLAHLQHWLLQQSPASTRLLLSEHYTERVLEDAKADKTLTPDRILEHADSLWSVLDGLAVLKRDSKFRERDGNASISVVVERWLGTHVANLRDVGIQIDHHSLGRMVEHSRRLRDLGFTFILFEMTPELIESRLRRTLGERNQEWTRYIEAMGGQAHAVARYEAWQRSLMEYYTEAGVSAIRHRVEDGGRTWEQLLQRLAHDPAH